MITRNARAPELHRPPPEPLVGLTEALRTGVDLHDTGDRPGGGRRDDAGAGWQDGHGRRRREVRVRAEPDGGSLHHRSQPGRGGGVAGGAADGSDHIYDSILNTLKGVVTFGQPMVCDPNLADFAGKDERLAPAIVRFIYGHDAVPHFGASLDDRLPEHYMAALAPKGLRSEFGD